jgi:mannitol/fructose-specific phosphotransferase system IIA component (Ntr-type)
LGFNIKGALRIGMGMIPRGELVLIIASVGLGAGIFNEQLFAVIVMMTLITILAAPPLMQAVFKMSGSGTRIPSREDDLVSVKWEFSSKEIADLVIDNLLKDLNNEGFYIQVMNIDEGLSQARKDEITLYITERENIVTIDTFESDMPFVKTAVYEVIVELHEAIHRLEESSVPLEMKKELLELEDENSSHNEMLAYINPGCISISLKGGTKKEVITELVDILAAKGKLLDRDMVLKDVLEREEIMNTGMDHGIALPHAKTDGVEEMAVAVGIKKEGIDFGALDGEKSRLFILMISPKRSTAPYLEFLAAVSAVLHDKSTREAVINAHSTELAAKLLRAGDLKRIF